MTCQLAVGSPLGSGCCTAYTLHHHAHRGRPVRPTGSFKAHGQPLVHGRNGTAGRKDYQHKTRKGVLKGRLDGHLAHGLAVRHCNERRTRPHPPTLRREPWRHAATRPHALAARTGRRLCDHGWRAWGTRSNDRRRAAAVAVARAFGLRCGPCAPRSSGVSTRAPPSAAWETMPTGAAHIPLPWPWTSTTTRARYTTLTSAKPLRPDAGSSVTTATCASRLVPVVGVYVRNAKA